MYAEKKANKFTHMVMYPKTERRATMRLKLKNLATDEILIVTDEQIDYPGDRTVVFISSICPEEDQVISIIEEADYYVDEPIKVGWHIKNEYGRWEVVHVEDAI